MNSLCDSCKYNILIQVRRFHSLNLANVNSDNGASSSDERGRETKEKREPLGTVIFAGRYASQTG